MDEEDVIMRLDTDGSGTEDVLAAIDDQVQVLTESLAALAETASDFTALDEAMAELSDMTAQGAEEAAALADSMGEAASVVADTSTQIDGLNATIDQLSGTIAEDTAIISALNEQITNLEAQIAVLTEEETGAEESTGGLGAAFAGLGEMADGLGSQMQAMMGPIMMVGTIAALAGGQIIGMGMSGQKGEALLRGMAGASQQDIQGLQQDALQLGETMDQASAGFYEVESAGYAGADALKVFDAASKLAEGGGASQQDMMSGLTAIMHDYNASADDATQYTDLMAEAIVRGKQSAQDFASNIGPLAAVASNLGISFDQVTAAEATMTQINPHVRQDTQELQSLFQFLSPTMGGVVDKAKSLGLAFDEQKYSSLDLIGKLQYLADLAGGTNTKAFAELTGGAMGSKAAIDLLQNGAKSFTDNLNAMKNSTGATQNAFDQFENTVPAHLDKVGAAFSIFSTKFMDAIGPKVIPIIDHLSSAVSTMGDWILAHTDLLVPALSALAAVIGTVLVGAIVMFVVANAPIIGILTAIGAVVFGVVYAFTHWGQIMGAIQQNPVLAAILHILQQVGGYLASLFIPIWQQLVSTWQTQMVPALMQLWTAMQPLMPGLRMLGMIIGGVIVVAIVLLLASITGLIAGLAGALPGIIRVFGGIVQVISGTIQVISGIIAFFVDLFTGKWSKLGADLGVIWGGIVTMFEGAWNIIAGIFQAVTGFITGLISGFATVILGILKDMGVKGTDHILDMINGMVRYFQQLPDQAGKHVHDLATHIGEILMDLGPKALQWAGDMIDQFVAGIENGIGKVDSAVSGIADTIKSIIGHSKPSIGPLADDDLWMGHMIDNFAHGVAANQGKLQQAMTGMAAQMAVTVQPGAMTLPVSGALGSPGGNDNQVISLLSQIAQSLLQIAQQTKTGNAASGPNVAFNAVSGSTITPQQFYQFIQSLTGYSYEANLRGAY